MIILGGGGRGLSGSGLWCLGMVFWVPVRRGLLRWQCWMNDLNCGAGVLGVKTRLTDIPHRLEWKSRNESLGLSCTNFLNHSSRPHSTRHYLRPRPLDHGCVHRLLR